MIFSCIKCIMNITVMLNCVSKIARSIYIRILAMDKTFLTYSMLSSCSAFPRPIRTFQFMFAVQDLLHCISLITRKNNRIEKREEWNLTESFSFSLSLVNHLIDKNWWNLFQYILLNFFILNIEKRNISNYSLLRTIFFILNILKREIFPINHFFEAFYEFIQLNLSIQFCSIEDLFWCFKTVNERRSPLKGFVHY